MFEDNDDDDKEPDASSKPDAAAKAEKEDNVEIDEESEDVKADEEGSKNTKEAKEPTPVQTSNLGKEKAPAEPAEPVKRMDFSLMDSLTSFLYQDEDPLPILCGYFNKIMQQLLIK